VFRRPDFVSGIELVPMRLRLCRVSNRKSDTVQQALSNAVKSWLVDGDLRMTRALLAGRFPRRLHDDFVQIGQNHASRRLCLNRADLFFVVHSSVAHRHFRFAGFHFYRGGFRQQILELEPNLRFIAKKNGCIDNLMHGADERYSYHTKDRQRQQDFPKNKTAGTL